MTTVACDDCRLPLNEDPSVPLSERQPCPRCGSLIRHFQAFIVDSLRFDEYVAVKHTRADADRSLPGKGVTRSYVGTRIGRDGRRVHREAVYDPYADLARERVVDAETGEVIVDKVESMKQKYLDRRRWQPPDSEPPE